MSLQSQKSREFFQQSQNDRYCIFTKYIILRAVFFGEKTQAFVTETKGPGSPSSQQHKDQVHETCSTQNYWILKFDQLKSRVISLC